MDLASTSERKASRTAIACIVFVVICFVDLSHSEWSEMKYKLVLIGTYRTDKEVEHLLRCLLVKTILFESFLKIVSQWLSWTYTYENV